MFNFKNGLSKGAAKLFGFGLICALQIDAKIIKERVGTHTLVLLDNWATIETHSMFFDHMRQMGHQVSFEMAVNPGEIKHYDDYFYDNIVFMAPSVKGKQTHTKLQ